MLAGVLMRYYCFGLTVASLAPLVGTITREFGLPIRDPRTWAGSS